MRSLRRCMAEVFANRLLTNRVNETQNELHEARRRQAETLMKSHDLHEA